MGDGGRSALVKGPRLAKPALQAARGRGERFAVVQQPGPSKEALISGGGSCWLHFSGAHFAGLVFEYRYRAAGSAHAMSIVSDLSNPLAWVGGASSAVYITAIVYFSFNVQRQ
jgi:hypothetical protein